MPQLGPKEASSRLCIVSRSQAWDTIEPLERLPIATGSNYPILNTPVQHQRSDFQPWLLDDRSSGERSGVDYHPNFQTIAFLIEEAGESFAWPRGSSIAGAWLG
jgi:hypothetical protein